MTNSKRTNTNPRKNNTFTTTSKGRGSLLRDIWLRIALGILTFLGIWVLIARWENLGYLATSGLLTWAVEPAILGIFVAIFSILFIYKSLTHRGVSLIAKIIACVLILTVLLVLVFTVTLSGQCNQVTSNCSTDFLFRLSAFYYTFLPIPVVLTTLTAIGTIMLLVSKGSSSTDR